MTSKQSEEPNDAEPLNPLDLDPAEFLARLGFEQGPCWRKASMYEKGEIELLAGDDITAQTAGVYAFVHGGEIVYVGEARTSISARLSTHKSPGEKGDRWILDKLLAAVEASDVDVFCIGDDLLRSGRASLQLGDVTLDEVALDRSLLERFLITVKKPKWNRR